MATMVKKSNVKDRLPGPMSRKYLEVSAKVEPRCTTQQAPVVWDHAEGVVVTDVDGNRYIDFTSGVLVTNVGHSHPKHVRAIQAAAAKLLNCYDFPTPARVELAERLVELAPENLDQAFMLTTGSEATEAAMRVAKRFTGRHEMLSFYGAFHGRTYGAMSVAGKTSTKKQFGPAMPGCIQAPYAYCYRCSYSLAYPECHLFCVRHLEDTFQRVVQAERVAAVVVEPILGEGGFVVPPAEYFGVLEEICRKHNILIVADEVQTGFGRTGTLFASEQFGFVPDLLVSAKSMAGGLPLAAITGRAEIMDRPAVGGLGGTFGGNPAACAAALAVMEIFEKENLLERSRQIGWRFQERASRWAKDYALIGDCRGLGAMQALELVSDRASRQPAKEETSAVAEYCYKHGLITITAGTYGNVIRTLMSLVVTDEQLEEGMEILEAAISQVSSAKSPRQAARE